MATATLVAQSTETWIYPPLTYTGVDYVYRPANTWTKQHSDPDRRQKRYQAGNSVEGGKYNGNMMSHFHFVGNGKSMKTFIRSIGGPGKITSIKLVVTCGHAYYSSMDFRVCLGPHWNTSAYHGKTADSYDGLGIKYLTTVTIAEGSTKTINLTAYKNLIANYETITMYVPDAYNKDYQAYGWVYGHTNAAEYQKPKLIIEYSTNSPPNKPGVAIHSASDSNGYYVPYLNFSIINNGDPDNNLHALPFAYEFYANNGHRIYSSTWYSSLNHRFDLSSYRGQNVRIRTIARDAYLLNAYSDKTIYINSVPYWANHGSESNAISFISGVTNGVYKQNVTIAWPRATDAQSQTIKYNVYCQIGTDSGAGGDNGNNCIAEGITSTSFTFDATNIKGRTIPKGERIYLSVWAHDGLEYSSYRLVSSWIYREQPPSAPSNVSPTYGHYESSVNVSWSESSGSNGSYVQRYRAELLNEWDSVIRSYDIYSTSFTCNDVASIGRGQAFKFRITAIDNLGNDSSPGYSGLLRRNSAPTDPRDFRLNSNSIYVKYNVPLIWTGSTDADGDAIRYNIAYSINYGQFQYLTRGISDTSYTHDVSSLAPGSVLNYYIEAYDSYNIYSNKTYIATTPRINTPPSPPSFLLPYENRILYTNVPRITFRVGQSYNGHSMKVVINVNGREYSSDSDVSYFDKTNYSSYDEGMFIVPDSAPLNYSYNNNLSIYSYDGIDYSSANYLRLSCDAVTVGDKNSGDFITANDLNGLKAMINSNRFAYGMPEINWQDGFLQAEHHAIRKSYFDQAIDGIHQLTTFINDKTNAWSLKRVYTKNTIATNDIINKDIFNSICNMIKRS